MVCAENGKEEHFRMFVLPWAQATFNKGDMSVAVNLGTFRRWDKSFKELSHQKGKNTNPDLLAKIQHARARLVNLPLQYILCLAHTNIFIPFIVGFTMPNAP